MNNQGGVGPSDSGRFVMADKKDKILQLAFGQRAPQLVVQQQTKQIASSKPKELKAIPSK